MAIRAEVAVIGLGAVGSQALLALARRGVRVIGIDRFSPPHVFGSTHGRSRVIREAYYESPHYVPLVQRAYTLWRSLAADSGETLLRETGGLMVGPPSGSLVRGSTESAERHGLPFEVLEAADIRRRFPVLQPPPAVVGVLEPRAGFLDPERCVSAALRLADEAGADLRFECPVLAWKPLGDGLSLTTPRGEIHCGAAVLAAGAWTGRLLEDAWPLTVERQVMYWFTPRSAPERFAPGRLPVFIWEWEPGRLFYGIPDHGAGFKVARHHEGEDTSPEGVDRAIRPAEVEAMRGLLAHTIPDANGTLRDAVTCLYTNTPDRHFVVGPHPEVPRLFLASACSGHGFKFASVLGEVLADLILAGSSRFDLALFHPGRFGRGAPG